jgi:DNA repair protein RadC
MLSMLFRLRPFLRHSAINVRLHPREVLGPALREGASALVLIHNHPSGDPTPSREDTRLTRQLVEAAQLLDLRIHDHVVIGNGSGAWLSFASRGLI